MTLAILFSRIEIAVWNVVIPIMSKLQHLRMAVQDACERKGSAGWTQTLARMLLWSVIGLTVGIILGLLGISAW